MTTNTDELPLAGLRVLDMTTLAMGPLAAQILGDYGADVIKVEPLAGDPFRQTLPMRSADMGHVYLQLNRNKRSLAIDLKAPGVLPVFKQLVATADILISNTRASGMRGLSLDYASVCAINPSIIYCAAYGFSEKGPYAGRPAADDTIQAMSGLVALQGRATAREPAMIASIVADKAAGLTLAAAVMAAVIRRMKTGGGQFIELPMFETMVSFVMPEHMAGLTYEPAAGGGGYSRVVDPSRRPYRTKDGYLSVLPYSAAQWQRFFNLVGREDLAQDPDLMVPVKRNARIPELYGLIAEIMPNRTTREWAADLLAHDILFGEVFSPEELLDDPHLQAVGLFQEVDHPSEGRMRLINPPVQSMPEATRIRSLPPRLGEHSREILGELGCSAAVIDDLVARNAIRTVL
jgi:crotonobetainyl-CoA:carnitine CoA-transferase CaiB-like acyl-CoA transferase